MPIYTFYCAECREKKTRMCKIDDRNQQQCEKCDKKMIRKVDFPGSVWSPTRNGGHS